MCLVRCTLDTITASICLVSFLFVSGSVNGQPDADLQAEKPEDRKALLFSFVLLPVVSPFLPNTSGTRDRVFHSRRFLFDLGSSARST